MKGRPTQRFMQETVLIYVSRPRAESVMLMIILRDVLLFVCLHQQDTAAHMSQHDTRLFEAARSDLACGWPVPVLKLGQRCTTILSHS